ncbi:maltose operon protein MalM [Aggregatibacter actinomycetemcomitans]|uniref:maltose operon protein MalM n=1 Tax=Aggregatibacter actinomycetemcomitans TaxID=714 RepID=UPI00197CA376|nr:maltose operon protein MalM [Aggregatibacter actinomycetemcomitans]MBN6074573.1 maltose operon protein MalM [Aggregatibacter actinomycetemcomitans]
MKKTMKFLTALLLVNMAVTLPSRANTPVHINSTALANLQWQDVSFSEKATTNLSEQQKQAFTVPFAGVESPIAAYRIPANQGTLEVEIISPIEDKSAFVPSAVVLDSNFNVAATYPSSEFKFQEERGMQPNRFAAELNLTPAASQGYIYLLIYTTQQDLAKTTMIPHPAKLYAKGTGHQPPALNDIEVKHSLNGQIIVNVTNANGTRFIGMPTNIFSSSDKKAAQPVGAAPASVTTANAAPSKAVNVPVDKDTEAYFNQAITKALKAGDVNKAMNLVNEAEKLGLTSPRQTFLKQVSSK